MRIGINALFLLPGEVGGSETYLCETLRAMVALAPADGFVLFTQRENDAVLRNRFAAAGNVSFVRLDFRAVRRTVRILREQIELPRRVRRERLDGLWSPGYTAPMTAAVPQAVSILDLQYRRFPDDLSLLARLTAHLLVGRAARRARCILTISEFSKSEILCWTRARPERIVVTPLAVSPSFAEPVDAGRRQAVCRRLLPDAVPFLLCVAHSYPHKNLAGLVGAFGRLSGHIPHRLVLVGKPRRGEPALRRALDSLPDPERVSRLAQVSPADLIALYQEAGCFVFPSLYEGFGLPVIEAMAAGTPVVASDIPAAHETGGGWIERCDARDPAALADAIRRTVTAPAALLAPRLTKARRHALSFTWERTARRSLEALRGLPGDNFPCENRCGCV